MTTLLLAALLLLTTPTGAVRPPLRREARPTPISGQALRDVMRRAHVDVVGHAPDPGRLAMLVALVRLEAPGPCYNLGSYHAVAGQPYVRVGSGRLRAYESHREAATALLVLLAARCSRALHVMSTGDAGATAAALSRCGYFRAPVERYANGLRGLL